MGLSFHGITISAGSINSDILESSPGSNFDCLLRRYGVFDLPLFRESGPVVAGALVIAEHLRGILRGGLSGVHPLLCAFLTSFPICRYSGSFFLALYL